jgi:hypothetical protein
MANMKRRRAASKGGKGSHGSRGISRSRSSEPMHESGRKGNDESQNWIR